MTRNRKDRPAQRYHAMITEFWDYAAPGGGRNFYSYKIVQGGATLDCLEILDQEELETYHEFETRVRARVEELNESSHSRIEEEDDD